MKTKAILPTLLVAAAAGVDARFAPPFPRKAGPPDESGHWIVINGNAWPDNAESELTTATLSGDGPDGLKSSPTKGKGRAQDWSVFILRGRHQPLVHRIPTPFVVHEAAVQRFKPSKRSVFQSVDRELHRACFSLRLQ
jgi:hypothetical protein